MAKCAGDASGWSLGLLCPLAPGLSGTYLYRVIFAAWIEDAAEYRREDVHATEVWATDAESARRMAQQEAEVLPAYRGSWRIRQVRRIAEAWPAGEMP